MKPRRLPPWKALLIATFILLFLAEVGLVIEQERNQIFAAGAQKAGSALIDFAETRAQLSRRKTNESFAQYELNHLLIRPKLFPRGAAFQGLIVWSGMESIPDEFAHGNILPATVVVYHQFNDAYPFQVTLWTDRRRKWSPEKCKRNSRAPLLSRRDPSPS